MSRSPLFPILLAALVFSLPARAGEPPSFKEASPLGLSPEPKTPPQQAPAPEVSPLSIPLVEGFPSFGLRLPDLDEFGKLRNLFVIGAVSKVNDRLVQLKDSVLETYGSDGSREMSIELPDAVLDRNTRVLVAYVPVTIRREEFELTGATMEFNTLTREGGLGGPVRMVLYNLDAHEAEAGKDSPKSSTPPEPIKVR